jgi:hypothetical protein
MQPPRLELDLREHLVHVANVPEAEHVADDKRSIDRPLSIAIVRSKLLVPYINRAWQSVGAAVGLPCQFNWQAVAQFHPKRTIVLVLGDGYPQAMMQISERHLILTKAGRLGGPRRGPLVYVSFLEVAPWNKEASRPRLYRGLGQLLLRFAHQRSQALGHGGVIGLHSLPTVEMFYLRLGFQRFDCPNEYHELYYELTEEAARQSQWMQ